MFLLKVAFLGDLHFYDGDCRAHKNYYQNCVDRLNEITAEFKTSKPDYIILSGDIIGVSERVLRTRAGLMLFSKYLQVWNEISNNHVYTVQGNHDISRGESVTDFDLLCSINLLKRADYVDINGLRVHLVDYGCEQRELAIDPSKHNFAVTHADLQIDGFTNWYRQTSNPIALSSLKNFKGIELIFGGHIHNPSPRLFGTSIADTSVNLLYLGCPTRSNRKDNWTGIYIGYADCLDDGNVSVSVKTLMLPKLEDLLVELSADEVEEKAGSPEDIPVVDIETLKEILNSVGDISGTEEEYRSQIKRLAGADTAAAEMALKYIEYADEHAQIINKEVLK